MAAKAELSTVHRYAAGGIFALALSQAHIQQHSLAGFGFPPVIDPGDDHHASQPPSAEGEVVPWSSEKCGLLRHIFRWRPHRSVLPVPASNFMLLGKN